jgi:Fe-S-cluster containining protein
MPFACSQCGECCSHLGLVHTIREDRGEFRYLVNNEYTGEKTPVTVDPDKIPLFLDRSIFGERPEACPFFRFDRDSGKGYCTVHLTRPEICRDYGCWRILILDPEGKRAGRIKSRRYLASDDDRLTRIFEEQIRPFAEPDDASWDERVVRVLVSAGYTVRM